MKILNSEEMRLIVIGSSWFGTGGGFPLASQFKRLKSLSSKSSFAMVKIEELLSNDLVCCAYGLGSAASTDVSLGRAFERAAKELERLVGKRLSAIFPAEPNIESAVFEVANNLKLPVLDADTTGGRAVPEISFDNFTLLQLKVTPIVACNLEGKIKVIETYSAIEEVEIELRQFSIDSNGPIAVLDHPLTAQVAKETLTTGTISRSLDLGKAIDRYQSNKSIKADVIKAAQAEVLLNEAIVVENSLSDRNGFYQGIASFAMPRGDKGKLIVKNEIMAVELSDQSLICTPDLIVPISPRFMTGLHSTELTVGREFMLVRIKAAPLWNTTKAKELVKEALCKLLV